MTSIVLVHRVAGADEQEDELSGELIDLGRDGDCALVIDADGVAPRQCRLVWSGGRWWLEHLGGKLATVVIGADERPVLVLTRRAVEDGDRIVIGHHARPIWSATVGGQPAAAPAPPAVAPPAPPPPPPVDERVELRAMIEALREELAATRQARDAAEHALAIADERRGHELVQLRHRLENELGAAQARVHALGTQVAELSAQCAEHQRRRREAERERDAANRERDAAHAEIQKVLAAAAEDVRVAEERAQVIEAQERELDELRRGR